MRGIGVERYVDHYDHIRLSYITSKDILAGRQQTDIHAGRDGRWEAVWSRVNSARRTPTTVVPPVMEV